MTAPTPTADRSALVAALQAEVHRLEGARPPMVAEVISSGCPPLDAILPAGGFPRGILVEWFSPGPGGGAGSLALLAAREACREGGAWVVCDRSRAFYPPAAARWGLDLERLILLHPRSAADEVWAIEQSLRCPGVAAVWSPLAQIDDTTFRRWQLAAEEGGGRGLLLRPARARSQPSWAQIQLAIEPRAGPVGQGAGRRCRIEIVRCHAGKRGGAVELELNEATGEIRAVGGPHVAHPLPASSSVAAGAVASRHSPRERRA